MRGAFANLLGVSQDTVRTVLNSWGPGKFDAELVLDGKAFRPDGGSAATLVPPAYGLAGVNLLLPPARASSARSVPRKRRTPPGTPTARL